MADKPTSLTRTRSGQVPVATKKAGKENKAGNRGTKRRAGKQKPLAEHVEESPASASAATEDEELVVNLQPKSGKSRAKPAVPDQKTAAKGSKKKVATPSKTPTESGDEAASDEKIDDQDTKISKPAAAPKQGRGKKADEPSTSGTSSSQSQERAANKEEVAEKPAVKKRPKKMELAASEGNSDVSDQEKAGDDNEVSKPSAPKRGRAARTNNDAKVAPQSTARRGRAKKN